MPAQARRLETAWPAEAESRDSRDDRSEVGDPRHYVAPSAGGTGTATPVDNRMDTLADLEPRAIRIGSVRVWWPRPIGGREERQQVVREFEGIVEGVDWENGTFHARMIDLTAGDIFESDMAEFPTEDLRADDKELLVEGAIFRVRVLYRIKGSGTKQRFTEVIFRRLPSWQPRHFELAQQSASELAAFFNDPA